MFTPHLINNLTLSPHGRKEKTMVSCAEIMTWTLENIRIFLVNNPNHIGAENALREVERQERAKVFLIRHSKNHAIVSGWTNVRRKGKCPTKKSLK